MIREQLLQAHQRAHLHLQLLFQGLQIHRFFIAYGSAVEQLCVYTVSVLHPLAADHACPGSQVASAARLQAFRRN